MSVRVVVKVGGSLYDWPELGERLRSWLASRSEGRFLLVPGGGAAVDVLRALDRTHHLGEETAHELALRMLSVLARFLCQLVPPAVLTEEPAWLRQEAALPTWAILDPYPFAQRDAGRPGALPASWAVTSDALATRVAVVAQASRLILLKSCDLPRNMSWEEAGRWGLVDCTLAQVLRQAPTLAVDWINFRRMPPGECAAAAPIPAPAPR